MSCAQETVAKRKKINKIAASCITTSSTNNAFDFILENNTTERRRSCHDNDQDKDNYDKKGARACDRPCLYIMNFVLLIVYYFMIIIMYYYHLMMIKGARACRPALLSLLLLLWMHSQWR